jgi:hypothetical protein
LFGCLGGRPIPTIWQVSGGGPPIHFNNVRDNVGQRRHAEHRGRIAVDATEEPELDAGGVRGEISRYVDPDSVALFEGMRTLVVGGLLTVMLTPELNALPAELKASDTKTYEPLGTVVEFQSHNHP